jgi:drug/metabolite transporter (DMT)-like permease
MELVLILGIILTATGILVGLYLPVLASHFATREKIRVYSIVGAALVLIGTACEIFAVWPVQIEIEQQPGSEPTP